MPGTGDRVDPRAEEEFLRGASGDEVPLWRTASSRQPATDFDDVLSSKALSNLDRQRFAAEHVHDGQRPEAPSIDESVGNEVHAPDVGDPLRDKAFSPRHHQLPPSRQLMKQPFFCKSA